MAAPTPEGIYFQRFRKDNDGYHNDPALSHSGMTKILISWPDFWELSCHNPMRDKYKPTAAMELGTRTGMYLLDKETFNESYNTVANFNARGKGICLSTVEMNKITEAVNCVMDVTTGKQHFSEGYPEVAIFWKDPDTGIMLRVKIDYLRTFGAIDFKRIKGIDPWTIGGAVRDQGLDIQNYLYLEGIKWARKWLRAMSETQLETFARQERVSIDWLTAFANEDDLLFRFLFQRSTPPYIWCFRELSHDEYIEGANATREAIKRYKESTTKWGFKKPPMGEAEVQLIQSLHVPRRKYDYVA